MMGGWGMFRRMWRSRKRHRCPVEDFVTVLSDAAGRISASADKAIAALQAAGSSGEDTAPIVDALNATSDRLDAAVAVASGTGTPPPAPSGSAGGGAPAAPEMPAAGGTPEQPAG